MSFRRLSLLAAATLVFCAVGVGVARAQGTRTVTDFTLKNAANAPVSLSSYAGSKAVVVVFISQNCPFSRSYQDRLNALASTYGSRGVQFLYVEAPINLDAANDTQKLVLKSDSNNITYLTDEGQKVSSQLGATKTPEAVVLQPAGNGFVVRYKGAIDDNPQVESDVRQRYLAQVLDNLLAGRPAGVSDTRASGCLIKKF
ncbi:redoxin domain-containing protein [Hymenobacter aerilatus]|uniref:Redoxin domain-containing protein n=1 Tax=Hymenobacter aerilatus TaxID=2932251 RepID=A0A8T9SZG8_9BACT|nr:redoxin domain-containing protein [Hymenobacter aerilatus]UOR05630.1 redoxin domain-containing protein [Hymenobacter aerilatus]